MESLARILASVYRGTPAHDAWILAFLEGAWSGLVGERIAQVCRPLAMRRQELTVEVVDPAWMATLHGMKPELLQRLKTAAGKEVCSLSFEVRKSG